MMWKMRRTMRIGRRSGKRRMKRTKVTVRMRRTVRKGGYKGL